jgi:hypothetical protein
MRAQKILSENVQQERHTVSETEAGGSEIGELILFYVYYEKFLHTQAISHYKYDF